MRALAPEYHEFRRIQLTMIISHEHKYLYVINPKVASTTVRNRLRELNGFPPLDNPRDVMSHKGSGFVMPKNISMGDMRSICLGSDYYNFSFVRNPFDRLVSAYVYFQSQVDESSSQHGNKKLYLRAKNPHRDPKIRTKMSFEEFIRGACEPQFYVQDQHWRLQTEILKLDLINYDFIGKMENFGADLTTILQRLDAPDDVLSRVDMVTNRSNRKKNTADYYDAKTAELVREWYNEDFVRFDYSFDVPQ